MMQLSRLTTQLSPGVVQSRKPVEVARALHPEGVPVPAEFPPVQDLAVLLNPPELQPPTLAQAQAGPDIGRALNPLGQPAPEPAPWSPTDFHALLNPPELQPAPGPRLPSEPVNIRQILDSPQGRLAENRTGSLTYLD